MKRFRDRCDAFVMLRPKTTTITSDQNFISPMNAFLAKNICNCHVESAIIKINNDERDFETEFLHEKTDKLLSSTTRYGKTS